VEGLPPNSTQRTGKFDHYYQSYGVDYLQVSRKVISRGIIQDLIYVIYSNVYRV
jgi:hypothetical protein